MLFFLNVVVLTTFSCSPEISKHWKMPQSNLICHYIKVRSGALHASKTPDCEHLVTFCNHRWQHSWICNLNAPAGLAHMPYFFFPWSFKIITVHHVKQREGMRVCVLARLTLSDSLTSRTVWTRQIIAEKDDTFRTRWQKTAIRAPLLSLSGVCASPRVTSNWGWDAPLTEAPVQCGENKPITS